MQKGLAIKLGVITVLIVILLIPLNMISSKISERSGFKYFAEEDIAKSWTGQQYVLSPILIIPYTAQWDELVGNNRNGEPRIETRRSLSHHFVLAEQLTINSTIATDTRARGIYKVPVYTSTIDIAGEFSTELIEEALAKIKKDERFYSIGEPYLSLSVSDQRGINSIPQLQWGDESIAFEPGSQFMAMQNGLHAKLPGIEVLTQSEESIINFQFDLELRGMKTFSIMPVARQSYVSINSTWQHPSFFGDFLPITREVNDAGFSAQWQTNSLSTNIEDKLLSCQLERCGALLGGKLGVSFIEPTIYTILQR